MSNSLGIGFIGAGGITRLRHAPGLAAIAGVDLVAVANRTRASGERFAADFGVRTVYADWRELLTDDRVDAVFIGTWPYLHSEISERALGAGKHVFCQARLAMDAADARRMLAAKEGTELTTMVCPPPHGMQFAPRIKQIVDSGTLGQIRHLVVRDFNPSYLDPRTPLHWRQRESLSGANTLTLGILYEVLLTWFGLRADWVLAGDATFVDERPAGDSSSAVERPDAVFVTAGLENGGLASLTFSSNAGGAGETAVSAYGTGASLHWTAGPSSSEGGNLTLRRAPGWTDEQFKPDPAAAWRVEADFIAAVRSGIDGNPNWELGLEYMQFVEAVERSARTGRRVRPASL